MYFVLQPAETPQVKVTSASSSPTEDQLAEAEQLKSDGMDIKSVIAHKNFMFFKNCVLDCMLHQKIFKTAKCWESV